MTRVIGSFIGVLATGAIMIMPPHTPVLDCGAGIVFGMWMSLCGASLMDYIDERRSCR